MNDTHSNTTPSTRFVIIGGVAAGASAAARARRLDESARITLIERGPDVSFANCGLPYHIGGEITDRDRLAVQTPETLKAMLNIEVLPRTEAVAIDRERKEVRVRAAGGGEEATLGYDKLLLAPGASPLRPPIPGIDDPRVQTLRNLQDMDLIKEASGKAEAITIVGAGFIGLEMAEQLHHLGKRVTVVELQEQVLPQLDLEMAGPVANALREKGIQLILGDGIKAFRPTDATMGVELASGAVHQADQVILSIGVRPESGLAKEAGLEVGKRGHIVVNAFQQTSDPDIYAAGDAAETVDGITKGRTAVPLGGPANRQGRLVADHIFSPELAKPYPGSIGTAIVRVFDTVAGVTGWPAKRLETEKIPYRSTVVTAFDHAGYYPGATQLTLKLVWSEEDGRILGAQVTGAEGVDKRLDVIATAIRAGMTIDDLAQLELAYAPPFGAAKDIVNLAGMAAANQRDGLIKLRTDLPAPGESQLIDLRPAALAEVHPLEGAVNIPLTELRDRLGEIDKNKPVTTICALGKLSYFGARVLAQHGYDVTSISGGSRVQMEFLTPAGQPSGNDSLQTPTPSPQTMKSSPSHKPDPSPGSPAQPVKIDATGMACPGPILRVREAVAGQKPGTEIEIRSSDGGFAADLPAFCKATGHAFLGMTKDGAIHVGRLRVAASADAKPRDEAACGGEEGGATLVVFSQDLDKALASMVIANGALAMGGPVTVFFTFWGLNVLRKEQPPRVEGKTFMDRMFGWMMPRGVNRLPLSNMHMMGMGTAMMKGRMASKNLPSLPGLLEEARRGGARLVACSMSMEAMGIRKEELIDGVEIGGVADFLGATAHTRANLFV